MKYVNPGVTALLTDCTAIQSTDAAKIALFDTGYVLENNKKYMYQKIDDTEEVWFSYDFVLSKADYDNPPILFVAQSSSRDKIISLNINKVNRSYYLAVKNNEKTLYTSDVTTSINDEVKHNIEVHFKTGVNGRIDVWLDTKLFMSYRSPTDFTGAISFVGIDSTTYTEHWCSTLWVSSIIIQNTRRIGLEKFKKLTIAPSTEQNMAQGSTTSYTLSGLTDAAEFSDITGVVALLQPTSRDANITTGTFALNGTELGTVDVSSSSGKDFVEAVSTVNTATTKPWTRDDIEGKTLTLKVDGAV